ncbi:hypothetical protein EON80_03020 [bacterium]|nr:MAG: hypothetical protein EON80_03020 [bacterium]
MSRAAPPFRSPHRTRQKWPSFSKIPSPLPTRSPNFPMKNPARRLQGLTLVLALSTVIPAQAQNEKDKVQNLLTSIRAGDVAAVRAAIEATPSLIAGKSAAESPLLAAIQSGKVGIVTLLLGKGSDPNQLLDGQTPLTIALSLKDENWKPLGELLLAGGAKIDGRNRDGDTPLVRAMNFRDPWPDEKVEWLLARGADVFRRNSFDTDVLSAAPTDEKVALIVKHVDVKRTDAQGNTPLLRVVARNRFEFVRTLLERGANINAQNADGDSCLHTALQFPSTGVLLKPLLDAGANANLKNNRGDLPLHLALRRRLDEPVIADGQLGNPLIHSSDAEPRGEQIALLITKSDINAKDQFGLSPLLLAVLRRDPIARNQIIKRGPRSDATTQFFDASAQNDIAAMGKLLAQKPDLVYFRLADGTTPLHVAALWRALDAAQLLVQKGADVNARDARAETPLFEALSQPTGFFAERARSMAKFLLGKKASVNAIEQNGSSVLHRAVQSDDAALIELIADNGANVNVRDSLGWTPIFWLMTHSSNLKIVRKLIEKGADLNIKAKYGFTLLSAAAILPRKELVELLVDNGADVDGEDDMHGTPAFALLWGGRAKNQAEVMSLLLAKGANPLQTRDSVNLLEKAIAGNFPDVVRVLLATGKFDLASTPERPSPLFKAIENNRVEIVKILLEAGASPSETDGQGRTALQLGAAGSVGMAELFKIKTAPAG